MFFLWTYFQHHLKTGLPFVWYSNSSLVLIQCQSSHCSNKLHIIFLIWKALNPIVLYHAKSNHALQLNTRLVQYSDTQSRIALQTTRSLSYVRVVMYDHLLKVVVRINMSECRNVFHCQVIGPDLIFISLSWPLNLIKRPASDTVAC